ncbi:MAG: HAMP domain-containing histidine kinase [Actinomycetota bacterium]|nr:HAMP domain-containing histidine kinase [Actinomycetota bacterium]
MSLRTRLVVAMLVLVALGLVVSGVATFVALQSFLLRRVDQQLVDLVQPVARLLAERGGERTLPAGIYAEVRRPNGAVGPRLTPLLGTGSLPDLPDDIGLDVGDTRRLFTVDPVAGGGSRFRALARPTAGGGVLVVALPLDDVATTLRRLVVIELVVASAVLVALGLAARWAVALSLRPLDEMGVTAGAIAAGDLSQRVPAGDERTEVGRLGRALNAMLSRIEGAFADRSASEERLRRFVADASHELRTPLTSIRGYAELFRRGAGERPEDLATVMRRIEEEATRMGVLVDDLLLLARLDQGRPLERGPVDLAAVAADAVADARVVDPAWPVALVAEGPTMVEGDDVRLRQVAGNLVTNARTHTAPGTPATVSVTESGGVAVLEVADEGFGLTPEEAERVFKRFYRGDASRTRRAEGAGAGGGSGLGLSIVAAIAEAHGGRASVVSAPGAGTRFRVELPRHGGHPGRHGPDGVQ